jgi:hypothetical protein
VGHTVILERVAEFMSHYNESPFEQLKASGYRHHAMNNITKFYKNNKKKAPWIISN